MARQFGSYSPVVPLGLTWEESLSLEDETGVPVDLTGYSVRAQLRADVPAVDPVTGVAGTEPLMEITTAGYYSATPAWPVVEGFSIPSPTSGTILLAVPAASTLICSPNNTKQKLVWDVRLVNKSTSYAIPVVTGKVLLLPRVTV